MALYYYTYRSWQDCYRRRENRSWPSVSVESVDSEYWRLNNAIVYAFIMRLTVEERVFILESYLKTMSYVHCRQSFFQKFRRQAPYIKIRSIRSTFKLNTRYILITAGKICIRKVAHNIAKIRYFKHIYTKWTSKIVRVFINKGLMGFESQSGVLRLCHGIGQNTFAQLKHPSEKKMSRAACWLRATGWVGFLYSIQYAAINVNNTWKIHREATLPYYMLYLELYGTVQERHNCTVTTVYST